MKALFVAFATGLILFVLLSGCVQPAEDSLVRKLCNNEEKIEGLGLSEGEFPMAVFKCSEYYSVRAPRNIMDAPAAMISKEGKTVAYCGGMPGPVPEPVPEECKIACAKENLCLGITIDCSKFQYKGTTEDTRRGRDEAWYSWARDNCYFENETRTSDKTYCEKIIDKTTKEACLSIRLPF